ncbi:transposase [Streptomyces sp. NPDC048258]|uniref:transposase n=1 Tax=Streptomyces sp. NPDC048258 TaxID=3365527 RepID=UPI0037156620
MHHLPLVEEAMGRQALALLRQLEAACASADDLAEASVQAFEAHADAEIITSFPGLGPLSGARVLAEIGDDRTRFADARGLKAYAGSAPVTRASGKSVSRRGPQGQEPETGRCRLHVGLLGDGPFGRSTGPLRPPTRGRRPPHGRAEKPLQPDDRLPAPLPVSPRPVQRGRGLPERSRAPSCPCRFTCSSHRMSSSRRRSPDCRRRRPRRPSRTASR